jgi:hypothetical protein
MLNETKRELANWVDAGYSLADYTYSERSNKGYYYFINPADDGQKKERVVFSGTRGEYAKLRDYITGLSRERYGCACVKPKPPVSEHNEERKSAWDGKVEEIKRLEAELRREQVKSIELEEENARLRTRIQRLKQASLHLCEDCLRRFLLETVWVS